MGPGSPGGQQAQSSPQPGRREKEPILGVQVARRPGCGQDASEPTKPQQRGWVGRPGVRVPVPIQTCAHLAPHQARQSGPSPPPRASASPPTCGDSAGAVNLMQWKDPEFTGDSGSSYGQAWPRQPFMKDPPLSRPLSALFSISLGSCPEGVTSPRHTAGQGRRGHAAQGPLLTLQGSLLEAPLPSHSTHTLRPCLTGLHPLDRARAHSRGQFIFMAHPSKDSPAKNPGSRDRQT